MSRNVPSIAIALPRRNLLALCCFSVLSSFSGAVLAQSASPAADEAADAQSAEGKQEATRLDAVQVTASRVARVGFEAPTPTTVLDREALEMAGNANIAETINELPAVRPSMTHTSTTNNSGFTGGNFMDLRGLGFRRSLVLVDGKRFVPTNVEGVVDTNMVPQGLVSRVEIVTGGASAAWGSDAVAGVANLILDRRFVGLKGSVQAGTTRHGDRNTRGLSMTWGERFADERGHFIVSADVDQNDGIFYMRARDWGGWNKIANPAYTADNDEPRQLLVKDGRSSVMSYGGLINLGPLAGIAFDADGNPFQFTYGDLRTASTMRGGDGSADIENLPMQAPVDRKTLYSRATFDFNDHLTGFIEGSYAKSEGVSPSLVRSSSAITIRRENPFIPDSIAQQMDDLNLATIRLGRYSRDYAQTLVDRYTEVRRVVAGFEGSFGETWSWDAYYTIGDVESQVLTRQNQITARYNLAIDAITDPVTGQAICRSEAARADGCAPLNLFGENQMSQASLDYVLGTAQRRNFIRQNAASLTMRGEAFSLPAGPVSVAVGLDWRHEEARVESDPLSIAGSFATGNTLPFSGDQTVKEAFGEAILPLFADSAWAKNLDLSLAARLTNYSSSGTVNTWKAGVSWTVNDLFRVRSALSRDIRAPSLNDMYAAGSSSLLSVFDPVLNIQYSVTNRSSGNPDLVPEEADTFTLGVVFTPTQDLGFSLDYYDVDMDKALITLAAPAIVERCYTISPQVCPMITRNPETNRITTVQVSPQNLERLHLRGVDFESYWNQRLPKGRLDWRLLVSYIDTLTMNDGETVTEMAGQTTQPTVTGIGGQPHWRGNLTTRYTYNRLSLNAAARYVGGGVIDHTWTYKELDVLEHSGRVYFDLGGSYTFFKGDNRQSASVFATIKNVADKDPPINGVGGYATTRALYDVIGRQYLAGVRFRF